MCLTNKLCWFNYNTKYWQATNVNVCISAATWINVHHKQLIYADVFLLLINECVDIKQTRAPPTHAQFNKHWLTITFVSRSDLSWELCTHTHVHICIHKHSVSPPICPDEAVLVTHIHVLIKTLCPLLILSLVCLFLTFRPRLMNFFLGVLSPVVTLWG